MATPPRHAGIRASQRRRIEEVLGWTKSVAGLVRKPKLFGQARLAGQMLLASATCNLIHMRTLGG